MSDLSKRLANLPPAKLELLAQRLKVKAAKAKIPVRRSELRASSPPSFAQQRLWFLDQLQPGNIAYSLPAAVRLRGPLNERALAAALTEVVRRHETLRTTFTLRQGQPVQEIHPPSPICLSPIDLQHLTPEAREQEAARLAEAELNRPFELACGPLYRLKLLRLSAEEHIIVLVLHHIISDGWSMGVLIKELAVLYEAYLQGRESPLDELPIQYSDYAVWQREQMQGAKLEADLEYWREQLRGAPAILELPTDYRRPAVQSHRGATLRFGIAEETRAGLERLLRAEGATLFMGLLAAWAVLLWRYTGQKGVVVGTPVANRQRVETEGLIGLFLNTLALRVGIKAEASYLELLQRVREVTLGGYEHQEVGFERLVEGLQPERSMSHQPLFQVMFVLQNMPVQSLQLSDLSFEVVEMKGQTAQFDLTLSIDLDQGLGGRLIYQTDLFDETTIKRMAEHFQNLLEAIIRNPAQPLNKIEFLTTTEREELKRERERTQREFTSPPLVHQLFEAQVERTPDSVALVFGDEQLTYRQLNERANQLAHHLHRLGVQAETLVGILCERSPEMVVAILGTLKAGGAYVPLDPAYPQERLRFMLEDAGVGVLLTQTNLSENLPKHQAKVVSLDAQWEQITRQSRSNLPCSVRPENLAYVIYTSGSTGTPKGVMISHHSIRNRLLWMQEQFPLTERDWLLQKTAFSFDASVWELFVPLLAGAVVVLAQGGRQQESGYLVEAVREHGITILQLVPSMLRLFLEEEAVVECRSLRRVWSGGERLTTALVERCAERLPWAELFNLYGPTEVSIDASCWTGESQKRRTGEKLRSVPIGRAIANTRLYVLDEWRQEVAVGVVGELYVSGAGVARGYHNRPELTAERFIPNPLSSEAGERMYRTGDLVRRSSDGQLEYVGRGDQQVKVRGYRIELSEIEAALQKYPSIREGAVRVVEDESGDKRLFGYVVAHGSHVINVSELRSCLEEKLPEYMIPAVFIMLEELPRLPNGKVDQNRLPTQGGERPELADEFAKARSAEEEVLAGIWSQVLKVEKIGINDNFFELGGHSLLVARVVSRVRKAFHLDIPSRSLFENPTVASLAKSLREFQRAKQGTQILSLLPYSREKAIPLSFAQQRLWFLDQLQPGLSAYNLISVVHLKGRLNVDALEQALNEIVRRHESLRTTFTSTDGRPAQLIHEPVPLAMSLVDLRQLSEEERAEAAQRLATEAARQPFDLSEGPLVRALLVRLAEDEHQFVLVLHHIISDGWSTGILIREMSALYRAYSSGQESPLTELTIQYADYAAWQREWLQGEALEKQLEYWREHLKGAPALLELRTDRPRPAVQSFRGARQTFALTAELTGSLKALSLHEEATLFMTLLAAFEVVLHYFSNQDEIIVGSPIANRNMVETESLIGLFVNTLVFRVDLSGNPTFRELLHRVREVAIQAYAHQDVPLEKLVDELQIERSLSHLPLFQVMLVLQNIPPLSVNLPDLCMSTVAIDNGTVQCDLLLNIRDTEEALSGALEYSTDLFEARTIARMLSHFEMLLQKISEQPEARLKELREMLADAETRQRRVEEEELLKVATQKLKSIRRRSVRDFATDHRLG